MFRLDPMSDRKNYTRSSVGTSCHACLRLSCIFIFIVVVGCQDSEYPPLTFDQDVSSRESTLEEGVGKKVLLCRTYSKPNPVYRWLKDGEFVTNASERGFSYKMENIQRSDAGIYRCMASNKLGSILSSAAKVTVAYMGTFADKGKNIPMSATIGGAVLIPLPAMESYPKPIITWLETDSGLNPEGEAYQISLDDDLALLNRELTDSGKIYNVEAQDMFINMEKGPYYTVTVSDTGNSGRKPPSIVVGPKDVIATEEDSNAKFQCIFNARPVKEVEIRWYKVDGSSKSVINQLGDKYLLSTLSSRTLTIKSLKPEDAGIYQCEASLSGFDTVVANATLTVHERPRFSSSYESKISRDFGNTVTITCRASGYPTPTVHWYFNSQELQKDYNSSSFTIESNGELVISDLDMAHAGMYQCFQRNAAGETSRSTWLQVNSAPPEMITPPTDVTIVEGDSASLPCKTRGAPKPTVTWSRVTRAGVTEQITAGVIMDDGKLIILSTVPADSGTYTCNASNSIGFITASADVNVYVQTQIVKPPQPLTIVLGDPASLKCGVTNDPNIRVTWQWLFTPSQGSSQTITSGGKRSIDANGTLTITGINSEDIGSYTCNVFSQGGNDSRTVTLTVIELPWQPVITNVSLDPDDVRGVIVEWLPPYNGNSDILSYNIQYKEVLYGDNSGALGSSWHTYNSKIEASATQMKVSGLKPARYYQFRVFASNKVGEGKPSDPKPVPALEMPQQPPSSPPKGFFGIPATNRSIRLGWQPPDEATWNGPLQGYTIRYRLAGYITFTTVTVNNLVVNPRYELGGLAFFQEYEVQIAAFNAEGVGVFSNPINVRTMEGHPTAPPKQLQAKAISSTTVRVTWDPPNPQFIHGINLGYKVLGKRTSVDQYESVAVVKQNVASPTGQQSTLLTKMLKYTQYNITVLCYTKMGEGPKATPVIVRTEEDVPSQVGSLTFSNIRSTSLIVEWTPPSEVNGVLQGYTLKYGKTNESMSAYQEKPLPSTNLTYTIQGLAHTTKYTILVYASTRKGPGPARSADIESGVPPEPPGAPVNLGVSNIQARSVLLQYLPGFNGKTSITLWIVEAMEGESSTSFKEIYQVNAPEARAFEVENLRPYTFYRLRIIAENIVARSPPSQPSREFQTLQDSPEVPPGSVTVRAVNSTALRVSWTPLSKTDWNGNPKGYKIYYKLKEENGSFQVMKLENGMNMDSAILGGLEEWMGYQVKMIAFNDVGNSSFSPITMERTREAVPSSGPANVSATAISSTSVNVTWGEVPKYKQNGMIQGFKIQYSSRTENIPAEFYEVKGNTSTSTIIDGLRKFVQYQVRVLAYTRMGDGVLSDEVVDVTTQADVPGPPVIIWFPAVTFTSATIVWEKPREPNGIITNYRVSYKLRDSPDDPYENKTMNASTKTITVYELQRQAHYEFRVTAKTALGWGQTATVEVFTMTNRSPPDSPSKPTIKSSQIQARSITISWIPAPFNGYGPLRNFTVQYKTETEQWTSVDGIIMPEMTTYSVQNLHPNKRYSFRVAATNDIGTSPFSVQSDWSKTLEDLPEGAPRNVKVEPLTTTEVKVTWEMPLPSTWNGNLLGYVLMYRKVGNQNFIEASVRIAVTELRLPGLEKYVNYEFLIKANNSIGFGPASTPVTVFVGEAAPTAAPLNIKTVANRSQEIVISWQPPPPDTHNGALSGYKIFYWIASESETTAQQIIVREQMAVLPGLQNYTDYAFTVQAYNLAGEGPKSNVKQQKTLEGLPGSPASINFWNVTYVSMDVSWDPPVDPNGQIVNYELSYLEESSTGSTKLVKFNVSGRVNSLHIQDLLIDTTYMFSISARTSVGPGHKIDKRITTGPQPGSPGKPQQVQLQVNDNGQMVRLTWENGIPGDTPIYGHIIESKNGARAAWIMTVQIAGDMTTAEISVMKLNPDQQYQFRVIALNTIGISLNSDPSQVYRTPAPAVAEPKRPFHTEWWFLVIVALTGLIIILIVVSLLCLVSRRSKTKLVKAHSNPVTYQTNLPNLTPSVPADSEDGGFGNFEMTRQSNRSRRQKFAGIRNGSVNNIYARSPPRPSPASVAYSDGDDDAASAAKAPLPDDDDDTGSSCTEKPSEFGDSTEPSDQESDIDSIDPPLPPPPPPASPPPPPFSTSIRNQYISEPINNSWQHQNNSSFNAYQYTDSEAESSHYAMSLNGGQIMLNNTAGSRAPLPGFSSFV